MTIAGIIRAAFLGAFILALSACGTENQRAIEGAINVADVKAWLQENEGDYAAHWVTRDTVLVARPKGSLKLLAFAPALNSGVDTSVNEAALTPIDMPTEIGVKFPHLAEFSAFQVDIPDDTAKVFQMGELMLVAEGSDGTIQHISYVQNGNVLDDLYFEGNDALAGVPDLGATITPDGVAFKLWAPTARGAFVEIFSADKQEISSSLMSFDNATGIWSTTIADARAGQYYRYKVAAYRPSTRSLETHAVTDPYSLGLSTDSRYSLIVDLEDLATRPEGWDRHASPELTRPEAQIIYETHIGDFSGTDESVQNPSHRGTYKAFLSEDSDGIKQLRALRAAGLNTIHLLPTYDLGSINEFAAERLSMASTVREACMRVEAEFCQTAAPNQTIAVLLKSFGPRTGDAQAVIEAIRTHDGYNWGYDPYHYSVPEGSYATAPEGAARIKEFRAMVMRLHALGFRVVMDVVYNHTFQAGLAPKSVLDKIVPGYYHRRHPITGAIEQSTCCDNTATERGMMAKLMIDSLKVWARDYRIDGFRFDLMGHQPKSVMLAARTAVRELDPDTYFYGEGWNFGEVANGARFEQAAQLELAGTEIGTFTDRLRDAVRGGSGFVYRDAIRKGQGLGNGLYTYPNELYSGPEGAYETYLLHLDQVRVGLAGNLADYRFVGRDGAVITGAAIDYKGAPTGYAKDPADTINYVSKHDNQTLWDNNQYRIPHDASPEVRTRMQLLSLAYPLYAQGIPFLHMGSELLRSKSFLRDSYDYGHWFNAVDYSKQSNNYDVGLPPAAKDGDNWALISGLLKANEGRDKVGAGDIAFASNVFMDMINIRASSSLFSLATAKDIQARVRFLNTGPDSVDGLIVMSLDDGAIDAGLEDIDPNFSEFVIVFNHSPAPKAFAFERARGLTLHPRQMGGTDPVVRKSDVDVGHLHVPAWTVAVFVRVDG